MTRQNVNDLIAFLAVARERSFTKAAARLGVSQSALSHTVRQLEARLDVRLLTRTTRAVAPTEAGERLLERIGPHFDQIEVEMDALNELKEKPAGTIRIVAPDYAISHVLWPKVKAFAPTYPDIKVELLLDNGLSDIVTERYDAGVRMGEQLAKDMISARIGPDFRFAVVGTKSYFEGRTIPQRPQDLTQHDCINYRFPSSGTLYVWEFEENGREIKVRVDGQLVFNNIFHVLDAALAGHGLGYVPEEIALPHLAEGRLERVLEDWSPYWDGYHLYYPSRRQSSPAFVALVEALRHRE
ncbi:LysR family transcriptional regulator [Agrobacterium deltaense]|uniref:LysR family transcriptional regulator n=1 Tax=Agrobacterium TaxID=357 RepID=UPI0007459BFF|nr:MULTISPECIES: LysR family transcriptional regulator [Agrobacterium]KVK53988.1 LysR family transcriptional regulator [Agrobacterium sp. D14]RKF40666.1 LysR family transcriptional regulator [Agrobacterium deltaense]